MKRIELKKLAQALQSSEESTRKKAIRYIIEFYGLEGASLIKRAYDAEPAGTAVKAVLKKALAYLVAMKRGEVPPVKSAKSVDGKSPDGEKTEDSPPVSDSAAADSAPVDSSSTASGTSEDDAPEGSEKSAEEPEPLPDEITEDWLAKQLFNEDREVRYKAIKAAADSGNPDLSRVLINHLEEEVEGPLKVAIIRILVILLQDKAIPTLLKLLVSGDDAEREAAAELVADFSEVKVIKACNKLATSTDSVSRIAAIYAAGIFSTNESISIVTRGLADVKDEVRDQSQKSLMILAESGNEEAKDALIEMGLLTPDNAEETEQTSTFDECEEKLAAVRACSSQGGKGFLSKVKGGNDENVAKAIEMDDERTGLLRSIGKELFSAYVGKLLNITYPTLLPLVKQAKGTLETVKDVKQNLEKTGGKGLLGKLAGKTNNEIQLENRLKHLAEELDNSYLDIGRVQILRRDAGERFSDKFERKYKKIKDLEKKLIALLPLIKV